MICQIRYLEKVLSFLTGIAKMNEKMAVSRETNSPRSRSMLVAYLQ